MSVNNHLCRAAFSLIELIIVVVIMGIVYTLSITSFDALKAKESGVDLQNLKAYMQGIEHEESVELICTDECSICSIYVDNEVYTSDSVFKDILNDSVKVYRYDFFLGIQQERKKVYFNSEGLEEDICFSYAIDKKGIGDQVLVEFKDRVYDFSEHLASTPVYDSLNEVVNVKENLVQEVLR